MAREFKRLYMMPRKSEQEYIDEEGSVYIRDCDLETNKGYLPKFTAKDKEKEYYEFRCHHGKYLKSLYELACK